MKALLAATTALIITGAGLAFAQQTPPASPTPPAAADARAARPTAEDLAALTDARIAALRAGLKLSAEQERNWPPVEAAIRELAKQRADRIAERQAQRDARDQQQRPTAIERLRRGADAMSTRAAALKRLADAAEPLYNSLDDGQKRRFALLMRMGAREGGPMRHWHRRTELNQPQR